MADSNKTSERLVKRLIFLDVISFKRRRAIIRELDTGNNISCIKIEYLSLVGLSLKNLNFVKYFMSLWYLDVRNNPVSNNQFF
jgi:hypothetical protein